MTHGACTTCGERVKLPRALEETAEVVMSHPGLTGAELGPLMGVSTKAALRRLGRLLDHRGVKARGCGEGCCPLRWYPMGLDED